MSNERRELIKALAVASYAHARTDKRTAIMPSDWAADVVNDADAILAALDQQSHPTFERGWTDPAMQSPPSELTDRDKKAVKAVMDALWKEKTITKLVDRFLGWPLPHTVSSDLCVTDSDYKFPRYGTSLLNADEAKQLMEYLFETEPPPTHAAADLFTSAPSQEGAGSATAAPGGEPKERVCVWTTQKYSGCAKTTCGQSRVWRLTFYSFCPFCGGKIITEAT